MFDYLVNLNEVQREAVLRTEGPALVIAGAGSGKTRVLTYRIVHLLKQGVKPSVILALTFTNKAAGEMKERIASIVGQRLSGYLWMGTFHSIFSRILRMEHEAAGFPSDYTIYDAADSKNLIRTILKEMGFDEKIYKPGVVANRISMAKNNMVTPAAYEQNDALREYDMSIRMPRICEIYSTYMKRCKTSSAMDFDDLLMLTNLLFSNHPDILEQYQRRFDYILVDEYQDTNLVQYLIIHKLAALHRNLCVVGDDAQSIYSFRGARIENIFSFQRDYPDHKVFKLEQNYRSTQTIVNAANSVISHNRRQIPKTVFSKLETGTKIKVMNALTDHEEGTQVAAAISETLYRDHFKYEDYAILYRTNAQSRIFEEALRRSNIPCKVYGGLSFYQRKEIKDLLAYFRVIVNPDDNEALKRIINYPARGLGQTTLEKLEKASADNDTPILKIIMQLDGSKPLGMNSGTLSRLRNFASLLSGFREKARTETAFSLAKSVASETGILKELYNDKSPEGVSRFQNIEELLNAIQEFSISAAELEEPGEIGDYLRDVALLTDQDHEKENDRNRVTMMTVHSAKGLEYKIVFIVGLEKNLFPSGQPGGLLTPGEYEEERRLFYVALTRAKHQVYLSHASQRYRWGQLEFCQPSPFLSEIDPAYLELPANESGRFMRKVTMPSPHREEPQGSKAFSSHQGDRLKPVSRTFISGEGNEIPASSQHNPSVSAIFPGMMVEHQRFGVGKVLLVEGSPPDQKATVFFQNAGQKQLLLRFARLRIIT